MVSARFFGFRCRPAALSMRVSWTGILPQPVSSRRFDE